MCISHCVCVCVCGTLVPCSFGKHLAPAAAFHLELIKRWPLCCKLQAFAGSFSTHLSGSLSPSLSLSLSHSVWLSGICLSFAYCVLHVLRCRALCSLGAAAVSISAQTSPTASPRPSRPAAPPTLGHSLAALAAAVCGVCCRAAASIAAFSLTAIS